MPESDEERKIIEDAFSSDGVNVDQEKERIYGLLEEYRTRLMDKIKGTDEIRDLFKAFMSEVRGILREKKLPPEMLIEVKRLVVESFDLLRELSKDRKLETFDIDEIGELVIGDAKKLSTLALPEEEIPEIDYEEVATSDLDIAKLMPDLALPEGECGYKGGVARIALKLYAKANFPKLFDDGMLEAELPLSDKDGVVGPNEDMWKRAKEMGIDPDGIEKRENFNIGKYMSTRDINMNQCLLTKDKLYFTKGALASVLEGGINSQSRANSLFGVDTFHHKKKIYKTGRMLCRLVKPVIEMKAKFFNIPKYNTDVQLGIYWLVLLRKALGKKDQAKRIAKIYSCAKQLNQTEAKSPKAFIEELLAEYPFFTFSSNQTTEDVAKWILTKYTSLIHRHLKQTFKIHPQHTDLQEESKESVEIRPDITDISDSDVDEASDFLDQLAA